ncbi:Cytochrome P450 [Penicillium expansum]|nr:Cytochrome P450 [Penicillium expansum]
MDSLTLYVSVLALPLGLLALRTVYHLYFHPLSRFPGPKLAAATFLYEFYYDVIKSGMYIWEIERMHEKYGPIVRINPREIHIKDSAYYDEIHASASRKRSKDPKYAIAFGAPNSLVGTITHDHHRFRRGLLNNYFSKRSVVDLGPSIHDKVDKLVARFEQAHQAGDVLHLELAFAALTADVITDYCYGWSYGYLDGEQGSKSNDLVDAVNGLMVMFHINRFFPFLISVFRNAPPNLLRWLQPHMADLFDLKARLRQQADDTLKKQGLRKVNPEARLNIFDALTSLELPENERTLDRLEDESALLLGAGTETTARSITVAMFYLIHNKEIMAKLRAELKTVLATPLSKASWVDLEKLPYLTGVVNEGLRLSHGMTARLARVSPNEPMLYQDWVIPAGSVKLLRPYGSQALPEPEKFDPERWIRAAEKGEYLSRYIVSFTKGSRQCLGMNLAYAEVYLSLAHIARRVDFALHETTTDNICVYRDMGIGCPKVGLFGVKATVAGLVEE